MRKKHKIITISLVIVVLSLILLGAHDTGNISQAQSPQTPTVGADDELAYIDPAGFINIVDPQSAGAAPFYRSPTGGYIDMVSLDVNGDGVEELIAITTTTAKLLVPANAGGTPPQFDRSITGAHYVSVSAGDFIPGDGGRDEIVLQYTDNVNYTVQIYDGNDAGTAWNLVYNKPFGAAWIRIAGGDIDGYEGDELIMMRNGTSAHHDRRIIIEQYVNNAWTTLFEQSYNFPWLDLAIGNTHLNNGNIDEIVTTRGGVHAQLSSFLIFQYYNGKLEDAPDGNGKYYPYFIDIAVGDINNSGDDEVFLIRDPESDNGISLLGRNWGADAMKDPWELSLGRDLKRVEMGDVDGDGKDEVVVARYNSYRVYWSPDIDFNNSGDIYINLRNPVVIQLGDFDGSGANPPKMHVSPLALGFTMTRGDDPPPSQTFEVTNIGGGIISNVHVDTRSNWLEVSPFDAAAPATFTVRLKDVVSTMAPGTYDAVITVTGTSPNGQVNNGQQTVNVRLTITPTGPILDVSPERYDFNINFGGVLPTPDPLVIRNIGDGGQIPYRIEVTTSDGGDWLRLSRYQGHTNDAVTVTLATQNLRPGDYSALITVTADSAISGSPATIPVTLHIEATGMVVTPTELYMQVFRDQPSPIRRIHVDQSAQGSGAIHWYAYIVPSGDWWEDIMPLYQNGQLKVRRTDAGLQFIEPDGTEHLLQYITWMSLTPDHGITPRDIQVSVDPARAPIGRNRVTIIVDGGPGTPNRFQGVDVQVVVAAHNGALWLPAIMADALSNP